MHLIILIYDKIILNHFINLFTALKYLTSSRLTGKKSFLAY